MIGVIHCIWVAIAVFKLAAACIGEDKSLEAQFAHIALESTGILGSLCPWACLLDRASFPSRKA